MRNWDSYKNGGFIVELLILIRRASIGKGNLSHQTEVWWKHLLRLGLCGYKKGKKNAIKIFWGSTHWLWTFLPLLRIRWEEIWSTTVEAIVYVEYPDFVGNTKQTGRFAQHIYKTTAFFPNNVFSLFPYPKFKFQIVIKSQYRNLSLR